MRTLHALNSSGEMHPAPLTFSTTYDLSQLKKIAGEDSLFIEKMLRMFLMQSTVIMHEMGEKYSGKNLREVQALAHRFKASIDKLGINLKFEIREIEKLAATGIDSSVLEELIIHVKKGISSVICEIAKNELQDQAA